MQIIAVFYVLLLAMLEKTEAFVLHTLKYGDTKLLVDLFCRQHGWQTFVVPLPRSSRSKWKKQYFQPLTLLYIEADIRQQQSFQKLAEATLLTPLPSLLTDPTKLAISLFVSEFLYHALRSEQQNTALFDYVRNSIEWLDQRETNFTNFHLVFLMHLSRFLGFYPNLDDFREGCYFDLRAATFCAAPPMHRDFLMPQESARIQLMMRMNYATMHLFRLNHADRNRIIEVLTLYYRLHLPQFPELHSLPVLQELFR